MGPGHSGLAAVWLCIRVRRAIMRPVISSTDLDSISLEQSVACFSALADPIRLDIVKRLAACDERCVCDLLRDTGVAPNLLSYHLGVLRRAGLIGAKRRGRWMDYRLVPEAMQRLAAALPRAGGEDGA